MTPECRHCGLADPLLEPDGDEFVHPECREEEQAPLPSGLRVAVGLSRKVGLPNYGSAEVSLHLSGITASTTDDEIDEALDAGRIAYDKMRERIALKVAGIREAS